MGTVRKLWDWLDALDRLSFLWSLIVAAKAKVAIMAIAFGSASWLDGVLVGLLTGGVAWIILSIGSFRRMILKKHEPPKQPEGATPPDQAPVKQGEPLAEDDLAHMDSRVLVFAVMSSTAIREQEKPFLEFTFSVFNGCVFPVRIDTKTEGRVKGNAIPLDLSPDVLNTAGYDDPVQHGHVHILKMRQYLSGQEANQLCSVREEAWENVPFDFTGLTVWLYPEIPGGKRKRLGLYSPVLIPQRELFL